MRMHSLLALPRRAVLGLRPRGLRAAVLATLVGASLACAPSASAAVTSTAPPSTPVHLKAGSLRQGERNHLSIPLRRRNVPASIGADGQARGRV